MLLSLWQSCYFACASRATGEHPMRRLRVWRATALTLLLMLNGVAAAVERQDGGSAPYQLGQGLQFPQYDLSVGGYVSVLYSTLTEQNWKLANSDHSLYLTKRFSSR